MGELYRGIVAPNHANCAVIQDAVKQYIEKARRIFGDAAMAKLSDVYVEFFPKGRNVAMASFGQHRETGKSVGIIQFSLQHVVRKLVVMLKQIVPHELAHVICMVNGWDMGHGKVWRQVCMMLGGNGETFSTLGYVDGRLKYLYEAKCPSGNYYWLTAPQRRTALTEGIVVETETGEQFTLTADSITGNMKPL